jgi:pilus assembly protein CpaE
MAEKILIVDDDLDTLKLVGLILQRHGYQIIAANGGVQALAKATTDRPDIILLDVMMPDMDGYEVTRRLRADTAVAHIPIIMFTAKTLLDDKVAGFEAGADDYLTKPTHPAELIAHVKALLARSQSTRTAAQTEMARVVGFLGAKGGVGTTTLAINVAAVSAQAGHEVILADLRPGSGSVGLMLGINQPNNLAALVTKPVGDLNQRAVGAQLVSHACGIRVLPAAAAPKEASLNSSVAQLEAIAKTLASMCKVLMLDLGTGLSDANRRILALCDGIIVVTDQTRPALLQTKALIGDIIGLGLSAAKVDVAAVNRAPSTNQMSWATAEQMLGQKIAYIITPAVELAYQAAEVGNPMALLRPDSITADQFKVAANQLLQKLKPA